MANASLLMLPRQPAAASWRTSSDEPTISRRYYERQKSKKDLFDVLRAKRVFEVLLSVSLLFQKNGKFLIHLSLVKGRQSHARWTNASVVLTFNHVHTIIDIACENKTYFRPSLVSENYFRRRQATAGDTLATAGYKINFLNKPSKKKNTNLWLQLHLNMHAHNRLY